MFTKISAKRFSVLVLALSVLLIFAACSNNEANQTNNEGADEATNENLVENNDNEVNDENSGGINADGIYEIGNDLPAGEYVAFNDDPTAGMRGVYVYDDEEMDLEASVFGFTVNGYQAYLTVEDGFFMEVKGVELKPVAETYTFIPEDGKYEYAMYEVGRDLRAGEYQAVIDRDEAWSFQLYEDSTHQKPTLSEQPDEDGMFTIEDGQYLWIQGEIYFED